MPKPSSNHLKIPITPSGRPLISPRTNIPHPLINLNIIIPIRGTTTESAAGLLEFHLGDGIVVRAVAALEQVEGFVFGTFGVGVGDVGAGPAG